MGMMKNVLSGIVKGGTMGALAKELDMNISTLMAMIDFMVDAKYLEIIGLQCSCHASNLCENHCGFEGGSQTKMYALTLKGEQFLSCDFP